MVQTLLAISLWYWGLCVVSGKICKNPLDYGTTTLMWPQFNGLAVLQQFLKHMGWKDFTFDSKLKKRKGAIFESVFYGLVENVWKRSSVLVIAAMFIAAIVLMSLRRTSENFPRNCPTTLLVYIPPPETGHGLDAVKWQMVKRISCQRLPWWCVLLPNSFKDLEGICWDTSLIYVQWCGASGGQRDEWKLLTRLDENQVYRWHQTHTDIAWNLKEFIIHHCHIWIHLADRAKSWIRLQFVARTSKSRITDLSVIGSDIQPVMEVCSMPLTIAKLLKLTMCAVMSLPGRKSGTCFIKSMFRECSVFLLHVHSTTCLKHVSALEPPIGYNAHLDVLAYP